MKRFIYLLPVLFLCACATDDIALLKKSVSELNSQNMELKKEIADLKTGLTEQDRKIKTVNEDIRLNAEAVITLKSDLKSMETRLNDKIKAIEAQLPQSKAQKVEQVQQKIQSSQSDSNKVYIEDNIADKATLYNLAMELYKSGRYEESIDKFRSFTVRFPSDSLADNSLYWMGESYLNLNNLEKAAESFRNVIENYPQENKVPDAMYKLGVTLDKLGKRNEAVDILKKLILNFKYSDIANTAKSKLIEWGVKDE
ncbi:tol-pal system protein YbgF [Calditerrivibrio nitroreducens]|uniref:Tol-pal system protein YbgF n=1 Tax=Calditerrivibrio nitroreducens (strain DSM 19672 / NBRC 101217 / Yu37-1) TaxID=768670 RepID=E4TGT7_CALNY|nr:tol-pal system protein YbgF [Calditerrivibrio nitroreducens]ADR18697.1 tol-pal system protein YbgF [Calditerrivibrio nitroreducens DSM 19672]